jgi:hypothetical protein
MKISAGLRMNYLALGLVISPLIAAAQLIQGDYAYDVIDGQAVIVGFNWEYAGDLAITNSLGGYPVTRIETEAFAWCEGLTGVTIPASVTSVGLDAFAGCTSLTRATFLDELDTFRANDVFGAAGALTSAAIGDSVTRIHPLVFMGCANLTEFSVAAANASFSSTNGVLFNKSQSQLIQYPCGKAGTYEVPDGVTSIADYAFAGCVGLTSVTIPASVTAIGERAFSNYTEYIGIGIASVGQSVRTTLAIPAVTGLTSIDVAAANACFSSTNGVLFDATQTQILQYPGGRAGGYAIPGGVTNLGDFAFAGCAGLSAVTLPASVTGIGASAFAGCTGLTALTLPASVTGIGWFAFEACTGLTSIAIPASVNALGWYAFGACSGLTRVCFKGDAPNDCANVFCAAEQVTVYYLFGANGWGTEFCERPVLCWNPRVQADSGFGFAGTSFGFTVAGAANTPIAVESCENLAEGCWSPVEVATLDAGGSYLFADPAAASHPTRFYRIVWP